MRKSFKEKATFQSYNNIVAQHARQWRSEPPKYSNVFIQRQHPLISKFKSHVCTMSAPSTQLFPLLRAPHEQHHLPACQNHFSMRYNIKEKKEKLRYWQASMSKAHFN